MKFRCFTDSIYSKLNIVIIRFVEYKVNKNAPTHSMSTKSATKQTGSWPLAREGSQMTTVSMDHTAAAKFTPKSFSCGDSHIYCRLAVAQPRIGDEPSPDFVAGAYRRRSRAR
jgi:hypothetical protein